MKVKYQIGTKSYTNEIDINNYSVIQKQLHLSFPMITSVLIYNNDGFQKRIYIGKKLELCPNTNYQTYFAEKYELSLEELIDLYLDGYTSVCLLNYKKYDQFLVGLSEDDEVVPDYYSLKERLATIANL